jgi:hypothetical protein
MADEQENVDAGSETSGDQAETSQEETTDTAAETTEKSEDTAQDAGGAAETEESAEAAADTDASRTGFAEKGLHAGDQCICPDGRKGTVHSFDAGFVCIPNHDQGE